MNLRETHRITEPVPLRLGVDGREERDGLWSRTRLPAQGRPLGGDSGQREIPRAASGSVTFRRPYGADPGGRGGRVARGSGSE